MISLRSPGPGTCNHLHIKQEADLRPFLFIIPVMLSPDIYTLFLPLLLDVPLLVLKFPELNTALANHTEQIDPLV